MLMRASSPSAQMGRKVLQGRLKIFVFSVAPLLLVAQASAAEPEAGLAYLAVSLAPVRSGLQQ